MRVRAYVQAQTTTVYVIDHLFFKSVCKEQQKERKLQTNSPISEQIKILLDMIKELLMHAFRIHCLIFLSCLQK